MMIESKVVVEKLLNDFLLIPNTSKLRLFSPYLQEEARKMTEKSALFY
jgi:hypothetical protein